MFENSKYLNKNSWKFDKIIKPYPFILIDDFLKKEIYQEVTRKFPDIRKFEKNGNIEGNNIQIRMDYKDFSSKQDLYWKEFSNYFLTEDFFYNFCKFYEDDIEYWYPEIFSKLKNKDFKIGIFNIDTFNNCDVLLDFHLGINTPVKELTSVRGPHLDNKKSLYTALCYLKDEDDNTNSGHFTVYKKKPYKILKFNTGRQINLSDVQEYKEIKYESNRVATFMNTKNSIHGVTPREVTNKVRKFFAFTAVYKEGLYKNSITTRIVNRVKNFF